MTVIVEKDGEFVNRVVADSLEIIQELYGDSYTVYEEVIEEVEIQDLVPQKIMEYDSKFYCPVCQSEIDEHSVFCSKCGTVLE